MLSGTVSFINVSEMKKLLLHTIVITGLALFLPPMLTGQFQWERVDESSEGPINRANVRYMVEASDGTPLLFTGDGIYRVEEVGDRSYRAILTDNKSVGYPLSRYGQALFHATPEYIYSSLDDGVTWGKVATYEWGGRPSPLGAMHLLIFTPGDSTARVLSADGTEEDPISLPPGTFYLHGTPSGKLFAAPSQLGTLYRSEDRGATWDRLSPTWPPNAPSLQSFASVGNSLLRYGPNYSALSADGGVTWQKIERYGGSTHRLLPVMTEDGHLWSLETRDLLEPEPTWYPLRFSRDSGRTWEFCRNVASRSTFLFPDGRLFTLKDGVPAIARSCQEPWVPIETGLRNLTVDTLLSHDSTHYALIERRGEFEHALPISFDLYRSDNGGVHWRFLRQGLTNPPMTDDFGNLYLPVDTVWYDTTGGSRVRAFGSRLYRSRDRGETWSEAFTRENLFRLRSNIEVETDRSGVVLISGLGVPGGNGQSFQYSTDSGRSFSVVEDWTDSSNYRPQDIALLRGGKVLSVGSRWAGRNEYIDYGFLSLDLATGDTTWLGGPDLNELLVGVNGNAYAWHTDRLYRSEDDGASWRELTVPFDDLLGAVVSERAHDLLYIERAGTWVSRNKGVTWEVVDEQQSPWNIIPPPDRHAQPKSIPPLHLEDGTILDLVHVDRTDPERTNLFNNVYHHHTLGRSTDNGETWDFPLSEELSHLDVTSVTIGSDRTLLVGTRHQGIYRAVVPSSVEEEIRFSPVELDLSWIGVPE